MNQVRRGSLAICVIVAAVVTPVVRAAAADAYGPHQLVNEYFAGWSGPAHAPCVAESTAGAVVQSDCDVVDGGMYWEPTSTGQLMDRLTGDCLDAANRAAVSGVLVVEDTCGDSLTTPKSQRWTIAYDTAGAKYVKNGANSSLCLTAYASPDANGFYDEGLFPCSSSAANQRWVYRAEGDPPLFPEGTSLTPGQRAVFDPTGCAALVYYYWLDAPKVSYADSTYAEPRLLGWVNGSWQQIWDPAADSLTNSILQYDGNFVGYGNGYSSGAAGWATGTSGHDSALTLVSGGDLQIVNESNGHVIWHTSTHITCTNPGPLPSGIEATEPIGKPMTWHQG